MDQDAIIQYITDTFSGVEVLRPTDGPGAGDTFFFSQRQRNASQLNRPGVFRLNVGLSRDTFRALFPNEDKPNDFAALDQLMPHPVYAPQSWVCVLNPGVHTFESIKPLLAEAHGIVENRHAGRVADG